MVEDADHNFTGVSIANVTLSNQHDSIDIDGYQMHDHVIATILEWWNLSERDLLKTGVWHTGFRGKL